MKTFVKKNLIAVFALLMSIGTMSFKMVEKSNQDEFWFEVAGDTIGDPMEPQSCPEGYTNPCAIVFSSTEDIPATVQEGREHGDYVTEVNKP